MQQSQQSPLLITSPKLSPLDPGSKCLRGRSSTLHLHFSRYISIWWIISALQMVEKHKLRESWWIA